MNIQERIDSDQKVEFVVGLQISTHTAHGVHGIANLVSRSRSFKKRRDESRIASTGERHHAVAVFKRGKRFAGFVRRAAGGDEQDAIQAETVAEIPAGRIGRPDDIADMIVFLCSERASYVNGAFLNVYGAATVGL